LFIDQTRFTVVGVSESKNNWDSEEPFGSLWVPESYGNILRGGGRFGRVQIALKELATYETMQEAIATQLEQMFPGYSVYVWGNVEDLYQEEQQLKASVRVLKAVGVMALVIGGVGIANITIAAIMERTREIGLRRAIGATDLENYGSIYRRSCPPEYDWRSQCRGDRSFHNGSRHHHPV
jgi:putative ABC transport system permease protein